MPHDPWTLIGWLLAVIILLTLLAAPIVGGFLLREQRRRRARIEAHKRHLAEVFRTPDRRFRG